MNKLRAAWAVVFPAVLMILGLSLVEQFGIAQNSGSATQQQPSAQPDNQATPASTKTLTGKIVQIGDKLVLSDSESKATYQLDDQEKAEGFLNANVKVTGVLDPSTGTIRVSDIERAAQ